MSLCGVEATRLLKRQESHFKCDEHKTIRVSELHTPIGTIQIEVVYRTKMAMLPDDKKTIENKVVEDIMVKSDHFPKESPRKNNNDKREVDLSKPLTAGAFVDTVKIKELHDALSQQLPPEPPMMWLLAEKDKMDKKMQSMSMSDSFEKPEVSDLPSTSGAHCSKSKAIEVPKEKDSNRYAATLMEFPFADGSPITELANFYQDCLQARSASAEWDAGPAADPTSLALRLQEYEAAVPEFDSMVASMFSGSEHGSDMS